MRNPAESQDDLDDYDNEGPIWPDVKLTAYDRRRNELRDLVAKRDAILAKAEITDEDRARLVKLGPVIERAQVRFEREGERAKDDLWRKRRSIEDWRAGEGREQYNASRRKVRHHPNADLSDMTAEQKTQHERDRRSDANWLKRQRDKGESEAVIAAAYAQRLEVRRQKRDEQEQYEAEMAEIRAKSLM